VQQAEAACYGSGAYQSCSDSSSNSYTRGMAMPRTCSLERDDSVDRHGADAIYGALKEALLAK
jgi:hypothetical protein